jgi:sialic acid synthase SpsE
MSKSTVLRIADRTVGRGEPAYIIAEAGSNHNRDFATAIALIDAAADSGVDAVKFQTFTADTLVARTSHPIATLHDEFARYGKTVHDMFVEVEMPLDWLPRLKDHASARGITFLSTPFDERSADVLAALDMPAFKVASYEIVHLPLLQHLARLGKPVLMSSGMASMGEIEEAIDVVQGEGNDQIALFHCPIGYPVAPANVNLAVMDTLRQTFAVPIGLSDHTLGIVMPISAVARGANLIEKHFTLDPSQPGPDHGFAIGPDELAELVSSVRAVEAAIGNGQKLCLPSERLHYVRGRRSLFATVEITEGQRITRDMIAVLRPGVGLPPKYINHIVGRLARRDIKPHNPITWDDV